MEILVIKILAVWSAVAFVLGISVGALIRRGEQQCTDEVFTAFIRGYNRKRGASRSTITITAYASPFILSQFDQPRVTVIRQQKGNWHSAAVPVFPTTDETEKL
jgi:hypothetical protein